MGIVLLIVGIIGFIWCDLPLVMYGILGLGNLTGMAVFLIFIFLGLFWKKWRAFVKKVMQKTPGKIMIWTIRGVAGIIAFLVVLESVLMLSGCFKKADGDATVVVLGCLVRADGPVLMLRERLDTAYDYLIEHPEAKCVLSGGQGKNEPMTEAKAMYDYLVEKGISSDRLYMEDKSTDTEENMEYTKELILKEGLNKNILIVSNEFHLYRAGRIAAEQEINYGVLPAHTHWWMFMTYYVRELYGILAECILGI